MISRKNIKAGTKLDDLALLVFLTKWLTVALVSYLFEDQACIWHIFWNQNTQNLLWYMENTVSGQFRTLQHNEHPELHTKN
jgi:hypothetical protein